MQAQSRGVGGMECGSRAASAPGEEKRGAPLAMVHFFLWSVMSSGSSVGYFIPW